MKFWKLGTNWGKGAKDFYPLLKKHNIVVSYDGEIDPSLGDIFLIAKGFSVFALAKVKSKLEPVTNSPELENDFKSFEVDYHDKVLIAQADLIELDKEDWIWYQTQDGMCGVNKPEIQKQVVAHLKNYEKTMELIKFKNLLTIIKPQIILQGPPGTGKTRLAQEIAYQLVTGISLAEGGKEREKQLKELEDHPRFKFAQFHPAYSYEDFVRGLSAEGGGDKIKYETKDRLLAEFAKEALANFRSSIESDTRPQIKVEQWVESRLKDFFEDLKDLFSDSGKIDLTSNIFISEVDSDYIRYEGENWKYSARVNKSDLRKIILFNLENQDIQIPLEISNHGNRRATYYKAIVKMFREFAGSYQPDSVGAQKLENYVLIIDEINRANLPSVLGELIYALEYRGHGLEGIYNHPDSGRKIILPPNLYIIGTMNTADRSVGHIDYAIRRRFAFVEVLPENLGGDDFEGGLFEAVSKLFVENRMATTFKPSKYLSSEFRPEDVWLGHSYFIRKPGVSSRLRLDYEIIPILKEYIKDGILLERDNELKDILANLHTHLRPEQP